MAQDNYSIEELLEIAESTGKSHRPDKKTDVDTYIKRCNISAGTDKIPGHIIYYHYRKWRKRNYMHRSHFFRHFSKIFEKNINESIYYLNAEPFDTSLEGSIKARVFLRKERDAQRQKKKESKS